MSDQPLTPEQARFLAIVRCQFALVHKMHREEAWLKGERVNHFVPLEDPEVVQKVCDIILEKGDVLLQEALAVLGLAQQAA